MVTPVTYPQIALNAQTSKIRFGRFDLTESLRRNFQSILDPARKAGRRGRIPDRKAQISRRGADHGLGPAQFRQWRADRTLRCRLETGPVLSQVISVGAVDDRIKAPCRGHLAQTVPQLPFAEVATVH